MPKSGFVCIIGRCNVGKSTLLNAILQHKVSIVSPIPQTTRHRVKGIFTTDQGQIIFVDTPGINLISSHFARHFNTIAWSQLEGVDAVLYVVDIHDVIGVEERTIISYLRDLKKPVVMALNKKDKGKGYVNDYITETTDFVKYFIPVSAIRNEGIEELVSALFEFLPETESYYYPPHVRTDFPLNLFVAEIIREKFLQALKDEVPHHLAVLVEEIKDVRDDLVYVKAAVVTSTQRHKGIIIGKNGNMIKNCGSKARKELKIIFGKKVHLDLWVKVDERWMRDPEIMRELGYAV